MNTTLLHLSLIDQIGPVAIQKIVAYVDHAKLEELYDYHVSDFITRCGLTELQAQRVVDGLKDKALLEQELTLIEKHKVQVITLFDNAYPKQLKEIHMPPIAVYIRGGTIACAEKSIAIIGSRLADRYGQRIIDTLVPPLVAHDWVIVSGGALGADTMAHQKTVEVGGKTVVVLGSGLLQLYPWKNKRLFDQVVASGGALVSAFPLMMQPLPGHFPARNRIIAGLSRGCIVVQAAQKSGARITAEFALEQGRNVFAVPGIFDDPLSMGCHKLIADGAQLITSVDDIFEAYGEITASQETVAASAEIAQQMRIPESKKAPIVPAEPSTPQAKIVRACHIPRSLDYLTTYTSLSFSELQTMLFDLQLSGLIEQDFTGQWVAL